MEWGFCHIQHTYDTLSSVILAAAIVVAAPFFPLVSPSCVPMEYAGFKTPHKICFFMKTLVIPDIL